VQLRGLVGRLLYKNRARPGNAAGVPAPKISSDYAHTASRSCGRERSGWSLAMRGRCRIAPRRRRDA